MSTNLQNCLPHLQLIAGVKNNNLRTQLLKDICHENCYLKAVREIAKNTIKKNIPLTPVMKKQLRTKEKIIRNLARKYKKKSSQQRVFVQSGGVLPFLIPAVISVVSEILAKKLKQGK